MSAPSNERPTSMSRDGTLWSHEHTFGQDVHRPGERRTWWVIGLTAVMMVVEIAAGLVFGSMALLADGLHMASHATALSIAAFAYAYARRRALDRAFCFGTGKVNSLAGFASAVVLILFALLMAWESIERFFAPIAISFDEAMIVAGAGLVVNGVSAVVLGHGGEHHDGHDHNLRAAYVHVIADALTSVLAIVALLAGKLVGWIWMDPVMGLVGAFLVARWALRLIRDTSRVLLDRQAEPAAAERIRESIHERPGDRLADLHVWSVGPGVSAAILAIVSDDPLRPQDYAAKLPADLGLGHVTVEVHRSNGKVE